MPDDINTIGPARTIEEVENESLERIAGNPNVPQLPFGLANNEWVELRNKLLKTDQLYRVSSGSGWGGYVAMRGNCVIGYQIVSVS